MSPSPCTPTRASIARSVFDDWEDEEELASTETSIPARIWPRTPKSTSTQHARSASPSSVMASKRLLASPIQPLRLTFGNSPARSSALLDPPESPIELLDSLGMHSHDARNSDGSRPQSSTSSHEISSSLMPRMSARLSQAAKLRNLSQRFRPSSQAGSPTNNVGSSSFFDPAIDSEAMMYAEKKAKSAQVNRIDVPCDMLDTETLPAPASQPLDRNLLSFDPARRPRAPFPPAEKFSTSPPARAPTIDFAENNAAKSPCQNVQSSQRIQFRQTRPQLPPCPDRMYGIQQLTRPKPTVPPKASTPPPERPCRPTQSDIFAGLKDGARVFPSDLSGTIKVDGKDIHTRRRNAAKSSAGAHTSRRQLPPSRPPPSTSLPPLPPKVDGVKSVTSSPSVKSSSSAILSPHPYSFDADAPVPIESDDVIQTECSTETNLSPSKAKDLMTALGIRQPSPLLFESRRHNRSTQTTVTMEKSENAASLRPFAARVIDYQTATVGDAVQLERSADVILSVGGMEFNTEIDILSQTASMKRGDGLSLWLRQQIDKVETEACAKSMGNEHCCGSTVDCSDEQSDVSSFDASSYCGSPCPMQWSHISGLQGRSVESIVEVPGNLNNAESTSTLTTPTEWKRSKEPFNFTLSPLSGSLHQGRPEHGEKAARRHSSKTVQGLEMLIPPPSFHDCRRSALARTPTSIEESEDDDSLFGDDVMADEDQRSGRKFGAPRVHPRTPRRSIHRGSSFDGSILLHARVGTMGDTKAGGSRAAMRASAAQLDHRRSRSSSFAEQGGMAAWIPTSPTERTASGMPAFVFLPTRPLSLRKSQHTLQRIDSRCDSEPSTSIQGQDAQETTANDASAVGRPPTRPPPLSHKIARIRIALPGRNPLWYPSILHALAHGSLPAFLTTSTALVDHEGEQPLAHNEGHSVCTYLMAVRAESAWLGYEQVVALCDAGLRALPQLNDAAPAHAHEGLTEEAK